MSIATVLQQEPFMLFYDVPRGAYLFINCVAQTIVLFVCINQEPTREHLPLYTCYPLLGQSWLTDQVRLIQLEIIIALLTPYCRLYMSMPD